MTGTGRFIIFCENETVGSAISFNNQNPPESSDSESARGALTEEMLSNITDDTERVRAAFTSPEGLSRISGDEERHVAYAVVMVVTDRRILFVAGESSPGELGPDAGSLAYDDIAAVAVEGSDPAVLALSMANGVRWEFPLPDVDPNIVDSVVRHLRWVGELRSRIVACQNDLEIAAGEIRDHAEAMEWERAEQIYGTHRDRLDQLIDAVQWTRPVEDHLLAPELTDMERTLERGYARLFIERTESQLELGQQLVENEDYDQARKVLQTAQEHHQRADDRAETVERGDDFRFGEQRELREELDRLQWEIEAVAAEPIRRAHEAKVHAEKADDPSEAVDHWETAFRRYGNVLTLDWSDDDHSFTGNRDDVSEGMRTAARELVDVHRELAQKCWDEGGTLRNDEEIKSALRACTEARDHVDRALELAEEFKPSVAPAIEDRRTSIEQTLWELRNTATVDRSESTDEPESEAQTETAASGSEEITEMDTHQDVTFEATVQEGTADGGRRRGFTVDDPADAEEDTDEGTADEEEAEAEIEEESLKFQFGRTGTE